MDHSSHELKPEQLRRHCDPSCFPFSSTAEIPPLKGLVEQERPMRAIRFGLEINSPGYNIYVSGLTGTGKTTVIKQFLDEIVSSMPKPDDWCFVYNFRDPNSPIAVALPAGRGPVLKAEMDEMVHYLKAELPKAFDSKEYERSMQRLGRAFQTRQQRLYSLLSDKARKQGFLIEVSQVGVSLVPLRGEEKMSPEEYEALEDEAKKEIDRRRDALQQDVNAFLRQVRDISRESRDRVDELNRSIGRYIVGPKLDGIREQYSGFPKVVSYLEEVQNHILSHLDDFLEDGRKEEDAPASRTRPQKSVNRFLKYQVNVVVDNTGLEGAPVVIETNPTYYNLFGRIERRSHFGALQTDFTMIRAGSYSRANGGYLVVNAHDVLLNPGVWETLKRTVKNKEVRIEDMGVQHEMVPVAGMRPSPIPANVKVIMIGNQGVYHLLYREDEEFRKIFKVKADFDYKMAHDEKALENYASFISNRCHHENLPHFEPSGVAEVAEYGSRLVEDQTQLSARFSDVADIVRESAYWAGSEGKSMVTADHVRRAIDEKYYRSSLVEERIRELITDGTILVDAEGETVGQVNGLSVLDLGDIRFGKPSRITAKTFMGRAGVVDIERESKMSGRIYEKGVLILSGYLGACFAQRYPLSLSASICFEQSYEGIDGDSASSTELYALLSSLSDLPIRQGIAVTGSVDQHGLIQPIGGVNEKIEGFFDVCRARGLTGSQGVMIPASNARNLMLRRDVVDAVREGRFHIYTVSSVEEGIEILTGVPAGKKIDGAWPEGTVHFRVQERLREFAEGMRRFAETAPWVVEAESTAAGGTRLQTGRRHRRAGAEKTERK